MCFEAVLSMDKLLELPFHAPIDLQCSLIRIVGCFGTFNCFLGNVVIVYTVIYSFVLPGIRLPVFQVVVYP